jgi:hypothetical protein
MELQAEPPAALSQRRVPRLGTKAPDQSIADFAAGGRGQDREHASTAATLARGLQAEPAASASCYDVQ